ncbi:hypothetical protein I6N95_20560 [Vagococcus sp. BWB3-3]|uniref:Uncharacterized protein n=1 Tax=Vagococcus allomyrinae TaxID=2794353 RepID=A0A940PEI3_9ENTE|nr:hypothetical protein [Vagococcus allomyrinae]MBP1043419.1 hypothetical protein [Vagococcus allomyrinae]
MAYIYIHLDTISNSVLSKGLSIADFALSVPEKPQNILLLDPNAVEGEFESHTGLKMIRGQGPVEDYYNSHAAKREIETKWIDFRDIHFLQQLTPMEIAELLYFSHMATQLHSPFFYKLQNNFVYFEKKDTLAKVFYRHLDDFYEIVAEKVRSKVYQKINERKSFFKAATPVASMEANLMKEFRSVFQEGVVLDFNQQELRDQLYSIPVYVVEDQVKTIDNRKFRQEDRIALITYDLTAKTWSVQQDEWDALPNLKQV